MTSHQTLAKLCSALLLGSLFAIAQAQSISGAGSSAAAPIYKSWAQQYKKATGIDMAFDASGSSAGIKKVAAKEADFGASDVAPMDADLTKQGLVLFPIAITGIAPVVNVPKLADAQLKLTGEVLARIFLGEITRWNAPEIAALNTDMSLPDLAIKVVVRSDGSGTTYNFTDYLAKVSAPWKDRFGVKTSFAWPQNYLQAKGSDGVVKAVKETPGAIGYVDFAYVGDNKLHAVQLRNLKGEFVKPSIGAFKSALLASDWASKGTFTGTLTNMGAKGNWPITMATFALVPQVSEKPEVTRRALQFFVWAFVNGDALVQENNFVRLPDRIQAAAFRIISSVKDKGGNTIGAGASLM